MTTRPTRVNSYDFSSRNTIQHSSHGFLFLCCCWATVSLCLGLCRQMFTLETHGTFLDSEFMYAWASSASNSTSIQAMLWWYEYLCFNEVSQFYYCLCKTLLHHQYKIATLEGLRRLSVLVVVCSVLLPLIFWEKLEIYFDFKLFHKILKWLQI